jgi:hypothetical protein
MTTVFRTARSQSTHGHSTGRVASMFPLGRERKHKKQIPRTLARRHRESRSELSSSWGALPGSSGRPAIRAGAHSLTRRTGRHHRWGPSDTGCVRHTVMQGSTCPRGPPVRGRPAIRAGAHSLTRRTARHHLWGPSSPSRSPRHPGGGALAHLSDDPPSGRGASDTGCVRHTVMHSVSMGS